MLLGELRGAHSRFACLAVQPAKAGGEIFIATQYALDIAVDEVVQWLEPGFLEPDVLGVEDDVSAELSLSTGARIGRKMFDANTCFPEPVYRLDWLDANEPVRAIRAVLGRIKPQADGATQDSDGLELVSVVDEQTGEDLSGRVALKLYPIGEHALHWTDTGMFDL